MATPDPTQWLLNSSSFWGAGTSMAARTSAWWDTSCTVTPLIGGYATMSSIRQSLEAAIADATGKTPGNCGFVYVAGWRVDPVRDLSDGNSWGTGPWSASSSATSDETAVGLFVRLMRAGIKLRILVWLPTTFERLAVEAHFLEHYYLYRLIQQESSDLQSAGSPADMGIVALDTRVGARTGAHHQKMIVIRGAAATQVAYCGGVDLAFTRRDAPTTSSSTTIQFNEGDWQSGTGMPVPDTWPLQDTITYPSVAGPTAPLPSDLPTVAYGNDSQIWHDQHLMLQGPIVDTLAQQFRERWRDPLPVSNITIAIAPNLTINRNFVYLSTADAYDSSAQQMTDLATLDASTIAAVPALSSSGSSTVQMWRTIPLRNRGPTPSLFGQGEFSNLSGVANACLQASEFIWFFDQYFWSVPLARLLNRLLLDTTNKPNLCVMIVLPPIPDDHQCTECYLRTQAILYLTANLPAATLDRIRVYNLWHPSLAKGIYCHAKVQLYDGSLLVCGSCNLNQRSFLCDTELACAVLDPAVVSAHQSNLWQLLFPSTPLSSTPNLNAAGAGQTFFNAFTAAATAAGSFLVEDEYSYTVRTVGWSSLASSYTTPASWPVPSNYPGRAVATDDIPGRIIEPTSLTKRHFPHDPQDPLQPLGLDVISQYLTTPPTSATYRNFSP